MTWGIFREIFIRRWQGRMTFSERLKAERVKKGVSEDEVAKALGVTQSYISKLENGIKVPASGMLIALSKYYDVTTDYLLLGDN